MSTIVHTGVSRLFFILIFSTALASQAMAGQATPIQNIQMNASQMLTISPCSLVAAHTVFASASRARGGNGSYASPYHTLARVEERLANDATITTVCLTGTFNEDLYLSDVQTTHLAVHGYGAHTTLHAVSESYAISNSMYSSNFDDLSFDNLRLEGFSYAGFHLEYIDNLTISNVTVEATGASYGLMLSSNGEITVDHVTVTGFSYGGITTSNNDALSINHSTLNAAFGNYGLLMDGDDTVVLDTLSIPHAGYAGISGDNLGDLLLTQSTIADTGSYAVMVNGCDSATIKLNSFSGYSYSGVDLDGDTALLDGNTFHGSEGHNGIRMVSSDTGLITNNFFMDHDSAGADVGESDGTVRVINNSFLSNRYSVDLNSGGNHELQVTLHNNIYSIPENGKPYGPFWLCPDCGETLSDEDNPAEGAEEPAEYEEYHEQGPTLALYMSAMESIPVEPSPEDNTELQLFSD